MKESKLYLNFFKKNRIFFVLPVLVLVILAFIYLQKKPPEYKYGKLFEMLYTEQNVSTKSLETDQAITILRSNNLGQSLKVHSKVIIFKNSPLTIKIETQSGNKQGALSDLQALENYLINKFSAKEVGVMQEQQINANRFLIYFMALTIGVLIGLFTSLSKSYFEAY